MKYLMDYELVEVRRDVLSDTASRMSARRRDVGIFVLGFALASFLFIFSTFNKYSSADNGLRKIDSSWRLRRTLNYQKESLNLTSHKATVNVNLKLNDSLLTTQYDDHIVPDATVLYDNATLSVSETLFNNVRVFCLITTAKDNVETRAIHVNATWAKRCNKHVFVSTAENASLPSVDFGFPEGRAYLWNKTEAAFRYVYQNELNNFDYFLKADDDTYVVMDNLRFMLLPYNPEDALYFGCKFDVIVSTGYMSGGAGYVLSREAVRRFANTSSSACNDKTSPEEDVQVGKCMGVIDATAVDTRDAEGRHRMLPFPPNKHLVPGIADEMVNPGFTSYLAFNYTQGEECCADYMVSFHYVDKAMLYVIDSFMQHFKLIGAADNTWKTDKRAGESDLNALKRYAVSRNNKDS
uniref:Glycoprotein-N-acetylgalactosamine 3-beta-galactosyltransferase 1 n=1 Tax=Panagrellus redivivus TaxID=6233 RepID=A0A7E4V054_PANRE